MQVVSFFCTFADMTRLAKISLLLLLTAFVNAVGFAQSGDAQPVSGGSAHADGSRASSTASVVTFSIGSGLSPTGFIPADPGSPDLKTVSKYIAIPKDASFQITLDSKAERIIENAYVAPAAPLSNDLDPSDAIASEDPQIYSRDSFFPADPIIAQRLPYRDFDLVLVSVALEQYNPVRHQLRSIDEAVVCCRFEESSNLSQFAENSLSDYSLYRSLVINPEFFDKFDEYDYLIPQDRREGCDYLIITPDDEAILSWADSLRIFRETQGIITKVLPLHEACDNTADSLKAFLKRAYLQWSPAPAAVLLLGDYSNNPALGITSFALEDHPEGHHYEPYMADNRLVDFNNDGLPDIVIARLPAANGDQAALMVGKTLQYERHPYTDEAYYSHPTTAMGFQLKRWFQLCSEVVAGYFEAHGKEPVHLNAIHQGTPDSVWSTGPKTAAVLDCFGPEGLGYIPSTMSHLTDWDAGANEVTGALEDGSFMLIHRDHGTFQSWGEPEYNNWFINRLHNDKLTFVMSANCQTGDFSFGNGDEDCLAERFLRIPDGAVGVIAASQLSYSFVNDTYVWGFFDYLYPDFMPDYGSADIEFQYPAYANAYGKYFLQQSSFPSNSNLKALTHNLFHYFGDAYLQLNTELPRQLSVEHAETVLPGSLQVTVKADEGAMVALSVNDRLLARRKSDGNAMTLRLSLPVENGQVIKVVATKQNHYRHESQIIAGSIGVNETADSHIKVYPNPTDGVLHIEAPGTSEVVVFNLLCQPVIEASANPDDSIIDLDCSSLPDGVYFIRLSGRNTTVKRFIKR